MPYVLVQIVILFDYAEYGRFFIEEKTAIDQLFHELPIGWSYPEKMAEVVSRLYPKAKAFSS